MAARARKESLTMTSRNVTVAMLAFGIAAGLSAPAGAQSRSPHNPTLNSVNQPVVQRTDYVIDLGGGNGVSERELGRLEGWFQSLGLGYGDRVSIDTGGYDDPRARRDIAAIAGQYGLLLSQGFPITAGTVQPGTVRVVVSRSIAFVPGCPDWSEATELGNRMSSGSNYGCAVNSNLAAMIADPNDLVLGQSGAGAANGDTASKAIKSYRDAVPTGNGGLKDTVTKGGK
jgi:pilus assembly protein CpaD